MGQKTSKTPSKTIPEKSSTHENDFAMYLLTNNEEVTLEAAQLEVAAHGRNAVILFPDPSDGSSSSSGSRKYKASFIRDGHWMGSAGIRQEVSIGNRNFSDAKFFSIARKSKYTVNITQDAQLSKSSQYNISIWRYSVTGI